MTDWCRTSLRARIYAASVAEGPRGGMAVRCRYCGAALILGGMPGDSEWGRRAATIDHVDPDGGNDPSNLVACCWQCNVNKGRSKAGAPKERVPTASEARSILRRLAPSQWCRAKRLLRWVHAA